MTMRLDHKEESILPTYLYIVQGIIKMDLPEGHVSKTKKTSEEPHQ